ncbi:uncharacterized protein LOC118435289 [Folsomia candida]|uniref:uncharacterized protein LOC118435289 n=1 Tax=Folsomia candida TaxID=158441 RepID=UPI0016050729|nr:uncharacterized protein LOC118435289 [Folsomia candida]
MSAIRFFISIRKNLHSHRESNPSPVLYFEICRTVLTATYMTVFKWTFWTKEKLFCTIVNDLATIHFSADALTYCSKRVRVTTLATWICILYSVIPICNVFLGAEVINVKHWKFTQLLESYAGKARYTFFVQGTSDPFPITGFDLATYFLVPIYVVMNFFYFLGGHYFDLSVLMGALTLRHLAMVFADTVQSHSDPYFSATVSKSY